MQVGADNHPAQNDRATFSTAPIQKGSLNGRTITVISLAVVGGILAIASIFTGIGPAIAIAGLAIYFFATLGAGFVAAGAGVLIGGTIYDCRNKHLIAAPIIKDRERGIASDEKNTRKPLPPQDENTSTSVGGPDSNSLLSSPTIQTPVGESEDPIKARELALKADIQQYETALSGESSDLKKTEESVAKLLKNPCTSPALRTYLTKVSSQDLLLSKEFTDFIEEVIDTAQKAFNRTDKNSTDINSREAAVLLALANSENLDEEFNAHLDKNFNTFLHGDLNKFLAELINIQPLAKAAKAALAAAERNLPDVRSSDFKRYLALCKIETLESEKAGLETKNITGANSVAPHEKLFNTTHEQDYNTTSANEKSQIEEKATEIAALKREHSIPKDWKKELVGLRSRFVKEVAEQQQSPPP